MHLWITNLAPDITDDDLRDLLHRYGAPKVARIDHEPGNGSPPGVVIAFEGPVDHETLNGLERRLDRLYWKNCTLLVTALHRD